MARLPGPLSSAVDAWSEYAESPVSHVAKAAGLVHFALSLDADSGRRVVEPRHHVIWFPLRDQGRQKHQSALFTLRVVREEDISRDPNAQGAVANHLRFKPPSERKLIPGADEYVEFELKSREHEVPSQQPLRISMGPVRADKHTGQKEYVRVDMGQCIQRIATDVVEDLRGGQRLVQNRWWMCIETLRLLCNVDHIDCTALDQPGVPPQEWVIRLMDTHAPINRKEELQELQEDRDIDDLMEFIDSHSPGRTHNGRGGAAVQHPPRTRKKKRGGRDKDSVEASQEVSSVPCAGSENTALGDESELMSEGLLGPEGEPTETSASRPSLHALPCSVPLAVVTASAAAVPAATPNSKAPTAAALDGAHQRASPLTALAAVKEVATPADSITNSREALVAAFKPALSSAVPILPSPHIVSTPPEQLVSDASDTDLMSELLIRYRQLQKTSGRAEIDAKVAVVRELLEVLDELERADAEMEEDSVASRVIFSAARKFEAKLRSLGLVRVEALGKPYNGSLHKAVGDAPEAERVSQVVVEELESGWVLGEDVVRPALVSLS